MSRPPAPRRGPWTLEKSPPAAIQYVARPADQNRILNRSIFLKIIRIFKELTRDFRRRMVEMLLAMAALVVWLYLIAARGSFWLSAERDGSGPAPAAWPDVIAVIPARNEAEGVGDTVSSLLRQTY